MTRTYFVTGTDTDVGKTICCKALLQAAKKQKLSTVAYKPIAAGCEQTADGLCNEDALVLQKNCTLNLPYQTINPIAFKPAIAPHIAAELENSPIDIDTLSNGLKVLQSQSADLLIVEGAGGWFLPLNNKLLLSDWVIEQNMDVILVVGMKLGCLNHALLTYEAVIKSGLKVAGWIANNLQKEMPCYQQNLDLLVHKINAPKIAEIPYLTDINEIDLSQFVDFRFVG